MTFWKRPRTLILTALILVAAWLVWRQSRDQAAAGILEVTSWVQGAVRAAAEDRELPPAMGETEPIVRDMLTGWVREAVPANVSPSAQVETASLREHPLAESSEATHRCVVTLQGKQIAVLVVWDGKTARAVGFERIN